MSEDTAEEAQPMEMIDTLRRQTEALQHELESLRGKAKESTMLADLKVAAIRAGMIDLDGIKLLDLSGVQASEDGQVPEAPSLMMDLKRNKPWLFGAWSTSSAKEAPPAQPPQQKQAMDMSDDEYAAARSLILKRRT